MLLDEIIDATVDEKVPIGTLLRKCLVLEQQVKNEKFRAWRRDLDETLAGLRVLEREAKERLDRALVEETKHRRSKNRNGGGDLRSS
jgi:AbiTii